MIELRTESSRVARHPRRQQRYPKTHITQQCCEQTVQLVTESPAAPAHDLVIQPLPVEQDRPPRMNIQILEWHAEEVRAMQAAQRIQAGGPRAAVRDAVEVRFDVHSEIVTWNVLPPVRWELGPAGERG